jgi:cell division protein FtsB
MLQKLPKFTRNFYFLFGFLFLVWMTFFDSNDLYSQYKLHKKVKLLKSEKAYYENNIEQIRNDRAELLTNPELLEKFARERYLMKKKSEDLFVIVEE